MLKEGIAENSLLLQSRPVFIVPNIKDSLAVEQKIRLFIGYKRANEQIENDKFSLPKIKDIYDRFGNTMEQSSINLCQGYYQAKISKDSRKVKAFTTPKGDLQMKRLPIGLKIPPSVCFRIISIALAELTHNHCSVYLYHIIIFGRTLEHTTET